MQDNNIWRAFKMNAHSKLIVTNKNKAKRLPQIARKKIMSRFIHTRSERVAKRKKFVAIVIVYNFYLFINCTN